MLSLSLSNAFQNIKTHRRSYNQRIYIVEKHYTIKTADNKIEVDEALKLRFNVFNLELGEGLES